MVLIRILLIILLIIICVYVYNKSISNSNSNSKLEESFVSLNGLNPLRSFDDALNSSHNYNYYAVDDPTIPNLLYQEKNYLNNINPNRLTNYQNYFDSLPEYSDALWKKFYYWVDNIPDRIADCGNISSPTEGLPVPDYSSDKFFRYGNVKVRQDLIGSNYNDYASSVPADFETNRNYIMVMNPSRKRFNTDFVFQGANYYYA
jgi:hypothetical protein